MYAKLLIDIIIIPTIYHLFIAGGTQCFMWFVIEASLEIILDLRSKYIQLLKLVYMEFTMAHNYSRIGIQL